MVMTPAERQNLKSSGAHYTPNTLARYVARQIVEQIQPKKARPVRVLDPAVGDGELLSALLGELKTRDSDVEAVGFDTDNECIEVATERLSRAFPTASLHLRKEDFLEIARADLHEVTLFSSTESPSELFDLVIANPPYVRTQVLGASRSKALTQAYRLNGRVDLYHAFIKGVANVLRPGGVAGLIVSNRFMTTRAGMSTRAGIAESFEILRVWDLGDTRLFSAAVLPAVLLLKIKGTQGLLADRRFTSVYIQRSGSPTRTAS